MKRWDEFLEKKLDACKRLLLLTQDIEKASADPDKRERLLKQRADILAGLRAFDHGEAPSMDVPGFGLESSTRVASLSGEIRAVVKGIRILDRRIREKLRKEQGDIRERLGNIKQGYRALRGYGPRRTIPRFVNKRW